ncbi:MAG: hypothetical protein JW889_10055 [Verrucomicrobia bacterium]|nr:hypothetical protein [Verrucomicrobiota bacterium]
MALKSFVLCALALLLSASCIPQRHEGHAAPERDLVTHTELAQRIVWMLGDEAKLPARATGLDYQIYLSRKGIEPLGGWRYDALVTKGDLAVVTVRLMGLQREVSDPEDEQEYIALLEGMEL